MDAGGEMKRIVLDAVIKELEQELERRQGASTNASKSAMHSAPGAEKQRDTTGLEAAYLAHGHSMQSTTLARQIEELKALGIEDFSGQEIDEGALVEVELDGDADLYFLLRCGGGTEVAVDGRLVTVITPDSPLGGALMGNVEAGFVSLATGMEGIVLEVF
ncbi:MAG: hypothetical protein ABFR47_03995 [Verrucomicrobiota bacterium]